jgi:DNA mismatch endonuclease (patch repair protein)
MNPTSAQVRYTMSRVRSSGSAIERQLGKALWQAGFRYRKQYSIFGKPDFVLVSARVAIFCDSEFWHGYQWDEKFKAAFKTNREYWLKKIERNRDRDKKVNQELKRSGWIVLRFWEHEITYNLAACVHKVKQVVDGSQKKEHKRGQHEQKNETP